MTKMRYVPVSEVLAAIDNVLEVSDAWSSNLTKDEVKRIIGSIRKSVENNSLEIESGSVHEDFKDIEKLIEKGEEKESPEPCQDILERVIQLADTALNRLDDLHFGSNPVIVREALKQQIKRAVEAMFALVGAITVINTNMEK